MKPLDMSDEETRATARQLAEAATTPEAWGPMVPEWIETISRDKGDLWVVTSEVNHPDGSAVVAVTGNGATSEANARFFVDAKRVVLGLLEEHDRLSTRLRNVETKRAAELRAAHDAGVAERDAEVATLRQIICDAARECGGLMSPECSLEFMALLPREIALATRRAEERGRKDAATGGATTPTHREIAESVWRNAFTANEPCDLGSAMAKRTLVPAIAGALADAEERGRKDSSLALEARLRAAEAVCEAAAPAGNPPPSGNDGAVHTQATEPGAVDEAAPGVARSGR